MKSGVLALFVSQVLSTRTLCVTLVVRLPSSGYAGNVRVAMTTTSALCVTMLESTHWSTHFSEWTPNPERGECCLAKFFGI